MIKVIENGINYYNNERIK
ncbi:hypothetical protein E5341_08200 [Ligilactobacillus murinus]|nr:hypothetical protein E5341_08200 [Ligilactobacillus murinus]